MDRSILKKRALAHNFAIIGSEMVEFNNSEATELSKFINKLEKREPGLSGNVASAGQVKGIVSVIMNIGEFSNFKMGNILVTSMTTPEYVPLMKKAAAIVTDEGGISCHAAIVARELKKPCIIGTKIATKVLKDGDLVEVDADKGVVKILKHENEN